MFIKVSYDYGFMTQSKAFYNSKYLFFQNADKDN